MTTHVLLFAAALQAGPPSGGDAPHAIVMEAIRAVEGDSAARVRARWDERLRRDPSDRAARLGLASLARLSYDYPVAERLYSDLYASDSVRPDAWAAYARLGFAEGLEARGFGQDALAEFTRAREVARAAGDRTAEGEALMLLTFSRGRLQGIAVAEATLDSAVRLVPATELVTQARIGERRATLHALRARATDAEAEARRAIAIARQSGVLRAEADAYRTLGKVLYYASSVDSALVALRRAEALYGRARDRSTLAASLIWMAQVFAEQARFGEWRSVMSGALRDGEATHNPAAVSDAHRAFGTLGIMTGDFASAAAHLEQSVAIARETGDSSTVRVTRQLMVDVLLAMNRLAEAKRLVQELLRTAFEPRLEFELHDALVAIAIAERDWAGAERALADARATLPRLSGGKYTQWLLRAEARLALGRGDLGTAERTLMTALRQTGADGELMRADAHLRLADIHARRGDIDAVERHAVAWLDELDAWRARSSDAELRRFAFQTGALQHEASVEVGQQAARAARVIAALAQMGRTEKAFEIAERRRARELRDRVLRAQALRTRSTERVRASAGSGEAPVTSAAIAGALPDDRTAVLEFVGGTSDAATTLFVIRRAGVTSHAIELDSLSERVARFGALLEAGADARALGGTLGQALLGSVPADVTRLVIVADGALHRLPWDALRVSEDRYAVERWAISLAPSAAVAVTLWRRTRAQPGAPRILAIGDPVLPRETLADATDAYRAAFDSVGGLPRLRASGTEARLVARYATAADVRLREDASAAFLKRAPLSDYQVIHFATHALVDEQSGARTALALAPGDGESGFVGPGDVAALNLNADLVVLSACRTARGVVLAGEGVQGLTAPFLEAGAGAVVATQWQIRDRGTTRFVREFYDGLAAGHALGEALRQARLAAIRRGTPPGEWAAFTLVGNPDITLALQRRADRRWWLLAGPLALLLVLLVARRLRRAQRAGPGLLR